MAKVHLDRLAKKYGKEGWSGKPYNELVQKIIKENTQEIAKRVGSMTSEQMNKGLNKITAVEKKFIVPDVSQVVPKESFFTIKAAQNSRLISENLRKKMREDLRETLNQFTPTTQEATYIKRRGVGAGQINPKLVGQFEEKIKDTFTNYTKKDPKIGVPRNIKTIAVTEMNSTINTVKREYMNKLIDENPGLMVWKIWLQHPQRSMEPREGHKYVNGKRKKFDELFHVPFYKRKGKRWVRAGFDLMSGPHDDGAPAGQVIGCHCDIEYTARWSS